MLEINKRHVREFLPEITLERIAPPYPKYPYFRGRELCPFRPDASDFDLTNAWWLIEASILAYAQEDFATGRFIQAGFSEVAFFSGASTQCYVANNDDFLLLVLRGTEIRRRPGKTDWRNIIADVMADADILLVDSGYGGKVHQGFKDALDEVWEETGLLGHLRSRDNGTRTFWFTGHSLGAALATLAAQRYGQVRGLYTYGSPRVGDRDFKNAFPVNTYRLVNNNDIVTRVPPPGLYHHVGDLKQIDSRGSIHDGSDNREGVVHAIQSGIQSFLNSLDGMTIGIDALIPEAIVDHVPLLYATHIWNNIL
jgi:triacylglycerol lipase